MIQQTFLQQEFQSLCTCSYSVTDKHSNMVINLYDVHIIWKTLSLYILLSCMLTLTELPNLSCCTSRGSVLHCIKSAVHAAISIFNNIQTLTNYSQHFLSLSSQSNTSYWVFNALGWVCYANNSAINTIAPTKKPLKFLTSHCQDNIIISFNDSGS